jgi:hypothetical protein
VSAVEQPFDAAMANICFGQIGGINSDGIGIVINRESDVDP